jgi:crotonobetainyl-CoA:carnitine CoA-transferase CaiB-like acyl-CoA transferase
MPGPLEGIRVVDWTQYGVGPFATSLLGAMGASVVHVEGPGGDPQRHVPPTIEGVSACFINFNTSKRSIRLNLSDAPDRQRMWRLIELSDVLVTNFKPSSVQNLGFTRDAVMSRNPDIIYCRSNGWGDSGPLANNVGSDPVLQFFGGWCSVTGEEDGNWEALRFLGHIDLNASMYIVGAVLTGLVARPRTGGQTMGLSMLEATLAMQSTRIAEYLNGGTLPGPLGSAASVVAPSQAFRCEDQSWVAVSAETDGQWQRLCEAIDRPDLAGCAEYATNANRVANRTQLAEQLGREFVTRPAWWWVQQLTRRQVPCSRFWDFELIKVHPQVRDNDHVIELDAGRFGTVFTGGPPWKFARAPARIFRNPESGEHTAEVLAELDGESQPAVRRIRTHEAAAEELPFSGLRVLELATGVAGPYCGSLFADQGADVLKLEPVDGDRVRSWGPPFDRGAGVAFVELNRNKRIGTSPPGSALGELADGADVVIVDAVDPDGRAPVLDLQELGARRPEVIVCSLSAYGQLGPLAGQPGSELTVQAMSNTWAGLGTIGKAPRRLGVDQAMMNAGLAAFQAITASLVRLERTGEGDLIHVSALGTHHTIKGMHWTCLSRPDQWPGAHLTVWTGPEDHGEIKAKDRPIAVAFSQRLGIATQPEEVRAIIKHFGGEVPPDMDLGQAGDQRWRPFWASLFDSLSSEEVARVVEQHGGTVTPWMDYADLDHHQHVVEVAPFVALDDSDDERVVRLPWRLDGRPPPSYRRPVEGVTPEWRCPRRWGGSHRGPA